MKLSTALASLALLLLAGCAEDASDRSDAPDAAPCPDAQVVVHVADASVPEIDAARPVTIRPVAAEANACYPNICWRGLKDDGPCSCPEVESACRVQYGAGYETECPALRSWASTCLSAPSVLPAGAARESAMSCSPVTCTELRDDGGFCDCQTISVACATLYGENYGETCPAFQGWARACLQH